jgi:F-type H+-transporting ATPase subunit b
LPKVSRTGASRSPKVYQAKLSKLDEELATARDALFEAGKAERDRAVTEAKEKAARMRRDAEFMVEQELKQVCLDIQRETVDAAIAEAEDVLKKRVTAADHDRLAEEYLADLSKLTASAGGRA